MAVPQADPVNVARALRLGFHTCILALRADHRLIEAKFLQDFSSCLDLLRQQAEYMLDRPVEAMDLAARRKFVEQMVQNEEVMSSIFGTPGQALQDQRAAQGGPPPAVVGVQTMFILNLARFCAAQNIPYINAPKII